VAVENEFENLWNMICENSKDLRWWLSRGTTLEVSMFSKVCETS
jgi:hypothetical protein